MVSAAVPIVQGWLDRRMDLKQQVEIQYLLFIVI